MRENELRINNIVIADDFECKIVEIKSNVRTYFEPDNYIVTVLEKGTNKEYSGFIGRLTGVSITEKRLLDFGFKLENNSFSKGDFHIEVSLSESGFDFNYYPLSLPTVKLDYIHQLQNLYFSLTGKELNA
jgi:hypothetical protein